MLTSSSFARSLAALALMAGVLLSLTACETLGFKSGSKKEEPIDIACPPVDAPAALSTMTKDGASANLRVVGSKCKVDDDSVTMTVNVDLTATRNAKSGKDELTLPFFAAITDKDNKLLNKKLYETTFTFGSDNTDKEELTMSFTLTKAQAASTQVTIGYQMSRAAWQAKN